MGVIKMEAKETVGYGIGTDLLNSYKDSVDNEEFRKLIEVIRLEQAETSFKAGYEQCLKDHGQDDCQSSSNIARQEFCAEKRYRMAFLGCNCEGAENLSKNLRKAGIKEVVTWIKENNGGNGNPLVVLNKVAWKSKLKEWRVE